MTTVACTMSAACKPALCLVMQNYLRTRDIRNTHIREFPGSSVGYGSSVGTAVVLVPAMTWVYSLAQELLHAADTAEKENTHTQNT